MRFTNSGILQYIMSCVWWRYSDTMVQAAASEGRLNVVVDALEGRGYSCTPSMREEAAAVAAGSGMRTTVHQSYGQI